MAKKELINKIVNVLVIVSSFLLLLNVSLKIQSIVNHKKYSSFFGYSIFEVTTGSMAGSIEIGDFILIKNTKNVKLNDIITFQEDEHFVTHRVVQLYEDKIITKGDSNNINDLPITRESVIGKVVKVYPRFGIIRNILLDFKILIPLTILFLIFLTLFDKKVGYKKHIIKDFIPESFNNISFDQKNDNFENVDENLSKTIDLSTIIVDNISIDLDIGVSDSNITRTYNDDNDDNDDIIDNSKIVLIPTPVDNNNSIDKTFFVPTTDNDSNDDIQDDNNCNKIVLVPTNENNNFKSNNDNDEYSNDTISLIPIDKTKINLIPVNKKEN